MTFLNLACFCKLWGLCSRQEGLGGWPGEDSANGSEAGSPILAFQVSTSFVFLPPAPVSASQAFQTAIKELQNKNPDLLLWVRLKGENLLKWSLTTSSSPITAHSSGNPPSNGVCPTSWGWGFLLGPSSHPQIWLHFLQEPESVTISCPKWAGKDSSLPFG